MELGPKTEEKMAQSDIPALEFTAAELQTLGNMLSGPNDVRIQPASDPGTSWLVYPQDVIGDGTLM